MKRINKELANIRAKFGQLPSIVPPIVFRLAPVNANRFHPTGTGEKKQLNGYQKKKYICKLLFTFLLGHEVEFGHMEAVNLMSALQYSEKQIVSDGGKRRGHGRVAMKRR